MATLKDRLAALELQRAPAFSQHENNIRDAHTRLRIMTKLFGSCDDKTKQFIADHARR